MTRFCAACGTEVEDTALFCPTCGQAIDQEHESAIPPAPAWPDSAPGWEGTESAATSASAPDEAPRGGAWGAEPEPDEVERAPISRAAPPDDHEPWADSRAQRASDEAWEVRHEEPTRTEAAAPPPPPPVAAPREREREGVRPAPRRDDHRGGSPRSLDLPITTPVMLSGWLIGVGALIAAIGVLIGLFGSLISPIDVLLLLLLLGIAATVFLSSRVPDVPHLKLITLATVLVGFGMALDRIGTGGAGAGELLFFFGTAAAAIGAIIVELGRDQPLGGPQR